MSSNEIQLRNDERTILLEGEAVSTILPRLIPLLDGSLGIDDIIERMKNIDKMAILDILYELNCLKILEDASIDPPSEITPGEIKYYDLQLNLFSQFNLSKYGIQRMLKQSRVGIIGLGTIGCKIAELLTVSGIGNITGIDSKKIDKQSTTMSNAIFAKKNHRYTYMAEMVKARCNELNPYTKFESRVEAINSSKELLHLVDNLDLAIVTEDGIQPSVYDWMNDVCIEQKINWSSCGILGLKGFVGPTIVPKQTACYKCFEIRFSSNLRHYREFLAYKEHRLSSLKYNEYGKLIMFIEFISNAMAMEVIKILGKVMTPTTLSRQMMFDFYTMTSEFHDVLRLPRCPACGLPSGNKPSFRPWM